MLISQLSGVCGIYLIRNTVNGKVYIGQSVDMASRWKSHVKEAKSTKSNTHLYKAMRKHGFDVFTMEALEVLTEPTQELMDEKETSWIRKYDACNESVGYNFRPGGQENQVVDEAARARISAKLKGRKMSPERIEQMRQASLGKPCSESAKKKISKFHTGIVLEKEIAEKIKIEVATNQPKREQKKKRILNTDGYKTEEFRRMCSERFKGKSKTEEQRKKMSEASKNRNPEAEAHRLAALRAVTKARWENFRARKEQSCLG